VFQSVGIGPDVFRSRYGELIQGDVSVTELRQDRVQPMYERIIEASEPIKAEYSAMYGVELTTEGLLAAALDPEMGESILAGQITMAEISGEARESGFALPQELTEQMYRTGKVDRAAADTLFMSAANLVPALNVLTRRHADPDDTFDLEEFVAADLFEDPTQRRRMRRLVNQERASFTGGRPGTLSTLQTGGVTGLRAR
jgi:hypothetical protein